MANDRKCCALCAAFNALAQECRRDTPKSVAQATPQGMTFSSYWPPTRAEHWCLQFVAGPEAGETMQ